MLKVTELCRRDAKEARCDKKGCRPPHLVVHVVHTQLKGCHSCYSLWERCPEVVLGTTCMAIWALKFK